MAARLYGLAMGKAEARPQWEGGPSREDLAAIQRQELEHFGLLQACVKDLGADPAAMMPPAGLANNLSKGVALVLGDPRTDLRQCLEALLAAELADSAGWEALIELARNNGQERLVATFQRALDEQQDHVEHLVQWLRQGVLRTAARGPNKPDQHRTH
jgi:ferritin-like protein